MKFPHVFCKHNSYIGEIKGYWIKKLSLCGAYLIYLAQLMYGKDFDIIMLDDTPEFTFRRLDKKTRNIIKKSIDKKMDGKLKTHRLE